MNSQEFVTCFYCNRILYFVPPPTKQDEAAKSEPAPAAEPAKEEPRKPMRLPRINI